MCVCSAVRSPGTPTASWCTTSAARTAPPAPPTTNPAPGPPPQDPLPMWTPRPGGGRGVTSSSPEPRCSEDTLGRVSNTHRMLLPRVHLTNPAPAPAPPVWFCFIHSAQGNWVMVMSCPLCPEPLHRTFSWRHLALTPSLSGSFLALLALLVLLLCSRFIGSLMDSWGWGVVKQGLPPTERERESEGEGERGTDI